jgi:hypothetical protein
MARIVTPTTGTPISASTFGVPLRNDYVSQTDTSDQTIASNLVFASGKRLTYQGGALPFVTVGTDAGCDYDETELQDATTALSNKGVIQLFPNTTYDISDDLKIVGLGTSDGKLRIIGGGISTIINQTASNKNAITLSNNAQVDLLNFQITMPSATSGHGIFGADTGANSKQSIVNSYMDMLKVSGCDSTHAPIWLKNPFFSDFGYLDLSGTSNALGLVLDATNTSVNTGNCHFRHVISNVADSAGYAVTLQALVASGMNFIKFDRIDSNSAGGCIHIKTANAGGINNNWFEGLDLEGGTTQIFIDNDSSGDRVWSNTFKGFMNVVDNQVAINAPLAGYGYNGNIFDLDIGLGNNASTSKILVENASINWTPNTYNFRVVPNGYTITTKITWVCGAGGSNPQQRNPNSGATASISDGGTIPHHLGITPVWANVSGSVAGEILTVSSLDATNITVAIKKRADGSAGTSQTVYWRAGWNSD